MRETFTKIAAGLLGTIMIATSALADDRVLSKKEAGEAMKKGEFVACFSSLGTRVIDGRETAHYVASIINPADSDADEVFGRIKENAVCSSAKTLEDLLNKKTLENSLR